MKKTVFITGANRGIGLEMARQYKEIGCRVIACCRSPGKAEKLQSLDPYAIVKLDVTNVDAIEEAANRLENETIDILINNAGAYGPSNEDFNWKNPTPWIETFHVMALAPYKISQAFQKQIERSKYKVIVNISSIYGSIALNQGRGDYFVYRSAKASMNATTRCLANQWTKQGVIVLALHPGSVKTEMNPYGKISVSTSVREIRDTLDKITIKDSGTFIDYLGNPIPW